MKKIFKIIKNWFKSEEKNLDSRLELAIKKIGLESSQFKTELHIIISDIEAKANAKLQEYKIDVHNDITDILNGVKKEKTALSIEVEKIVDDLNSLKLKAGSLAKEEIEILKEEFNKKISNLLLLIKSKI